MTFAKDNAALAGFNRWTINGVSYPLDQMMATPLVSSESRASGIACGCAMPAMTSTRSICTATPLNSPGSPGSRPPALLKDVVMVGGYQETEIDFTADNPGLTLFHCHQQLHMDYGFMSLFDYER